MYGRTKSTNWKRLLELFDSGAIWSVHGHGTRGLMFAQLKCTFHCKAHNKISSKKVLQKKLARGKCFKTAIVYDNLRSLFPHQLFGRDITITQTYTQLICIPEMLLYIVVVFNSYTPWYQCAPFLFRFQIFLCKSQKQARISEEIKRSVIPITFTRVVFLLT